MPYGTPPEVQPHPPPVLEIDGVGVGLTKAFSGAAGRFREAATDVVAWQPVGVSFS